MGEIDEIHQPKRDGKPAGQHEQEHAIGYAVEQVGENGGHGIRLEPFPFRLNRNGALAPCLDAFSSREPGSTSLENALAEILHVSSWPGLSRPSTSYLPVETKDVDARDKPGHDAERAEPAPRNDVARRVTSWSCRSP